MNKKDLKILIKEIIDDYVVKKFNLQNLLYISVNLNEESSNKLKDLFINNNPWGDDKTRIICHHMTIAFHTMISDLVLDYTLQNLGKTKELKVIGYGFSEKAFAVLIETDVPSTNLRKHITCAVNLDNNGKPVDSNSISNWKLLPKENVFNLNGCVTINYKNKRGV